MVSQATGSVREGVYPIPDSPFPYHQQQRRYSGKMKKTALNQWHIEHGATMTDFNGWHMPLYYKGITQEHTHTRTEAGLFDLGHMGRIFIRGPHRADFINHLTPARVSEAKSGEVQYTFLLQEDGTVIDDITVYFADEEILLVINAGNRDVDLSWIREQATAFGKDVEIDDRGESWSMIALQGPKSHAIAVNLFGTNVADLPYYQFAYSTIADLDGEAVISRTGYTGEDGYEIYLPSENALPLWEKLMSALPDNQVQPIGLGARDSLRLEAGMPLYGHELDRSLTPLHANLGRFIDFEKTNFIGRAALQAIKDAGGPDKRLIGFEMLQRGPVARQGFPIQNSSQETIGEVTSGIFSPTLQKTIGLAYVNKDFTKIGTPINVEIRGRALPAQIIKRPFYKRNS